MDIDDERLRIAERMAHNVAERLNVHPTIKAYKDRKDALEEADYVINTIQVGGYPSTLIDFEVPKRYGLQQTIGDTLGIGGIFRALRTIPVLLDICHEMEQLCPHALFLNYVNPMAMNTWVLSQATSIQSVGLCHSVQHTAGLLSEYMGITARELMYLCAGINHMAFYLELTHTGNDVYPLLREVAQREEIWERDPVRFELFQRLGYFVTESSEHSAEYNPYFIRRDSEDLIERFHIPIDEYIRRCQVQNLWWEQMRQQCCVEVPCLVDTNGIQPTVVGSIPPQLAALQQTNINVQGLVAEAMLTGKKEHIYHAAMFDPHTSAELTLDEIHDLVDDLFAAHGEIIPQLH